MASETNSGNILGRRAFIAWLALVASGVGCSTRSDSDSVGSNEPFSAKTPSPVVTAEPSPKVTPEPTSTPTVEPSSTDTPNPTSTPDPRLSEKLFQEVLQMGEGETFAGLIEKVAANPQLIGVANIAPNSLLFLGLDGVPNLEIRTISIVSGYSDSAPSTDFVCIALDDNSVFELVFKVGGSFLNIYVNGLSEQDAIFDVLNQRLWIENDSLVIDMKSALSEINMNQGSPPVERYCAIVGPGSLPIPTIGALPTVGSA